MKVTAVSAADLDATGRMDAGFHCLLAQHRPVYNELLARFTTVELVDLAHQLPYDQEAAFSVLVRNAPAVTNISLARFEEWLSHKPHKLSTTRRFRSDLAAYCAAACQHAASKVLTEVLALKQEELAKLQRLQHVLELLQGKEAPATLNAVKGKQDALVAEAAPVVGPTSGDLPHAPELVPGMADPVDPPGA
jgi:hypothetical protein